MKADSILLRLVTGNCFQIGDIAFERQLRHRGIGINFTGPLDGQDGDAVPVSRPSHHHYRQKLSGQGGARHRPGKQETKVKRTFDRRGRELGSLPGSARSTLLLAHYGKPRFSPKISQTVRMVLTPPDRKKLVWPVAGIVLGVLVATNPFYAPDIMLPVGIVASCVDIVLILILSAHPTGARTGSFMAGLFLAVPCFIEASPLSRGLLMCCMAAPFLAAAALVLAPPIANFRARLAYLLSWCGTRQVKRRARNLDMAWLPSPFARPRDKKTKRSK